MTHDPSAGQPRNSGKYAERVYPAPSTTLEAYATTSVPYSGISRIYGAGTELKHSWPASLPEPIVDISYSDTGHLETNVQIGDDTLAFWGDTENFGGITCGATDEPEEYPDFSALSPADQDSVEEWGKEIHERNLGAVRHLTGDLINTPEVQSAIIGHSTAAAEPEPIPYAKRAEARVERIAALYDQGNDAETTLGDILADLRHYAALHDVDFDEVEERSIGHFHGELEDDALGNFE